MDNHNQSSATPIIPILLGASIGAAAGLLLAPRPGIVTRQKLIERVQEIQHKLEEELKGEKGTKLKEMAISALQSEIAKRSSSFSWVMKGLRMLQK
jgi:gas vesicle protein